MSSHVLTMMKTADIWRAESKCMKRQVAAVIADDRNHILSIGYNGTHPQAPECNTYFSFDTSGYFISNELVKLMPEYPFDFPVAALMADWIQIDEAEWRILHRRFAVSYETHAEVNAILNLLKTDTKLSDELSIFVTCEPCTNCCKTIVAAGIKHVFFEEEHGGHAKDYFNKFGVTCEQIQL